MKLIFILLISLSSVSSLSRMRHSCQEGYQEELDSMGNLQRCIPIEELEKDQKDLIEENEQACNEAYIETQKKCSFSSLSQQTVNQSSIKNSCKNLADLAKELRNQYNHQLKICEKFTRNCLKKCSNQKKCYEIFSTFNKHSSALNLLQTQAEICFEKTKVDQISYLGTKFSNNTHTNRHSRKPSKSTFPLDQHTSPHKPNFSKRMASLPGAKVTYSKDTKQISDKAKSPTNKTNKSEKYHAHLIPEDPVKKEREPAGREPADLDIAHYYNGYWHYKKFRVKAKDLGKVDNSTIYAFLKHHKDYYPDFEIKDKATNEEIEKKEREARFNTTRLIAKTIKNTKTATSEALLILISNQLPPLNEISRLEIRNLIKMQADLSMNQFTEGRRKFLSGKDPSQFLDFLEKLKKAVGKDSVLFETANRLAGNVKRYAYPLKLARYVYYLLLESNKNDSFEKKMNEKAKELYAKKEIHNISDLKNTYLQFSFEVNNPINQFFRKMYMVRKVLEARYLEIAKSCFRRYCIAHKYFRSDFRSNLEKLIKKYHEKDFHDWLKFKGKFVIKREKRIIKERGMPKQPHKKVTSAEIKAKQAIRGVRTGKVR